MPKKQQLGLQIPGERRRHDGGAWQEFYTGPPPQKNYRLCGGGGEGGRGGRQWNLWSSKYWRHHRVNIVSSPGNIEKKGYWVKTCRRIFVNSLDQKNSSPGPIAERFTMEFTKKASHDSDSFTRKMPDPSASDNFLPGWTSLYSFRLGSGEAYTIRSVHSDSNRNKSNSTIPKTKWNSIHMQTS